MMKPTLLGAILMMETVVDLAFLEIIVRNVLAFWTKGTPILLLEMATAMMKPTMQIATMMMEIVVCLM